MKGYPRSQFDIINNTSVSEITTAAAGSPTAIMMATYTSDKGKEGWELLYGLNKFTTNKGGLNFTRHGQPQLLVAELLRNGAYVLAKRLVSKDANLANTTIKAKVVQVSNVSYLYLYGTSCTNATTFADACSAGYDKFDASKDMTTGEVKEGEEPPAVVIKSIEIPIMTVGAVGRGVSNLSFRINPEYYTSKGNSFLKYSFETIESTAVLESIPCTLNPDIVLDGNNMSVQDRVAQTSEQLQVKMYNDGIFKLVSVLSETATLNNNALTAKELINIDFINGYGKKGDAPLGGIATKNSSESLKTQWEANKPAEIKTFYAIDDATAIPLTSGTNGILGNSPITNMEEYEKLLLGAWGKDQTSHEFSSAIYDLDNYKVDAIFDCAYPMTVKNAITDLVDFRGDCTFIQDLGISCYNIEDICNEYDKIQPSKFCAVYHNFFDIIEPYSKKQITVTMPFLLAPRMIKHIANGVGRPFAGATNGIEFPEIIEGTMNFLPVVIPGQDQKQQLVDHNINYISYYDGVPVMETMYTNDTEYSQLSFLHNIMGIQEIIKILRTKCPKTRYTFLEGDDLETYIDDAKTVINEYKTNFKDISIVYLADEKYESNNIFYASLKVKFKNFVQEEYFKIIAIN